MMIVFGLQKFTPVSFLKMMLKREVTTALTLGERIRRTKISCFWPVNSVPPLHKQAVRHDLDHALNLDLSIGPPYQTPFCELQFMGRKNRSPCLHNAIAPDCRGLFSPLDSSAAMPGRTLKLTGYVLSGSLSLGERVRVRASLHPLSPWRSFPEQSSQSGTELGMNNPFPIQHPRPPLPGPEETVLPRSDRIRNLLGLNFIANFVANFYRSEAVLKKLEGGVPKWTKEVTS
jgi:hypothetical protein